MLPVFVVVAVCLFMLPLLCVAFFTVSATTPSALFFKLASASLCEAPFCFNTRMRRSSFLSLFFCMCARLQVPRSPDTEEGKANGVSLLSLNRKKAVFFCCLFILGEGLRTSKKRGSRKGPRRGAVCERKRYTEANKTVA